jgi:hypothetical protein
MNRPWNLPLYFNLLLFAMVLVLNLSIPANPPLCEDLDDPADYLHQAELPLFDKEFYAPHRLDSFHPRPFTVPLFYKLCNGDETVIIQVQKWLHTFSAFLLIYSLLLFIKRDWIKYALTGSIYLLMCWWNILGWSLLLLSESISMSLLFCWLATFLIWFKHRSNVWLVVHLAVAFFFSFTRDSWPYALVAFYGMICIWFFVSKDKLMLKGLVAFAFSVLVFIVQGQTAKTGLRSQLPVLNTLAVRIAGNTEYLNWFAVHGMPCAEKLKSEFGGIDVRDTTGQQKIFAFYEDSSYQPLFDWVNAKGQGTYMLFLLTHPAYTFLAEETPAQLQRIFAHDLFYTDVPRGYVQYLPAVFPLWKAEIVLVLLLVLAGIYWKRRDPILILTLCFAAFVILNAWLCYNADALEVERHLFITQILVELTGFWSLALIMDSLGFKART